MTLFSCSDKNKNCTFTIDQLIRENANKLIIVDSAKGKIFQVVDFANDSAVTGDYVFFNNGRLKSYKFFAKGNAYTYNEEYSIDGNLVKIEGKPIVYNSIELIGKDSIHLQVYFFSLQKNVNNLHLNTNDGESYSFPFEKSSEFSNMSVCTFRIRRPVSNHIRLYLKVHFFNECKNIASTISDTLAFRYDE